MKEDVLCEDPGFFRLVRTPEGTLVLEVLCGTLGVFAVKRTLSQEEVAFFRGYGEYAARTLALRISRNPTVQ